MTQQRPSSHLYIFHLCVFHHIFIFLFKLYFLNVNIHSWLSGIRSYYLPILYIANYVCACVCLCVCELILLLISDLSSYVPSKNRISSKSRFIRMLAILLLLICYKAIYNCATNHRLTKMNSHNFHHALLELSWIIWKENRNAKIDKKKKLEKSDPKSNPLAAS